MKTNLFTAAVVLLFLFNACTEDDVSDVKYNEMSLAAFMDSGQDNYPDNYPDNYRENYNDYEENPFIKVSDQPVSTFSVDADGGSYANMRRFLYLGQTPPKASVRIEEYLNYFTFDYAEPQNGENVSLNSELSSCPWNTEHYLMRLGMKGKTIPENELPNSNYVFLIDVSGSMNSPEKLGILKSGFKTMTDNLKDQDRIAIVTYAGEAGVLLPSTYCDEKEKIKAAIDKLGAGGSTAGAAGIITAYEIAEENFIPEGNNRVILGSDGDFNVGASSTDELVELIEEKRESGIYLTVLGVGSGNLNDYMMEQIANKGNGNYEYIDNAKQIQKVFTHEFGKFFTVAKDSKIQLTFNENTVDSYRLIGYENRSLENEDFENDSTDAGEIGSSQTITALYELVLANASPNEKFAQFDFRYKKPNASESQLIMHEVNATPTNISNSSENMQFAAGVGGFGLMMKQSEYKGEVSKQMVLGLLGNSLTFDPFGYRQEFVDLVSAWQE
ncbi:VWA domain-containing protein [Draconibacterium orientale]|uniref:vWA domain-containing protein n=1 Tax=Draconibacterium orientale TaxID=1168034 RepID=UPI0029C0CFE1|nr:VWA domain-containing protein [Draconibacterium orientale]